MLPVVVPFTPSASSQVTTIAASLSIVTAGCLLSIAVTAIAAITAQATVIKAATTITAADTIAKEVAATVILDTAVGTVATTASEPA